MNKPSVKSQILFFAAAVIFGSFSIIGQSVAGGGESFEATLHVVIGSDDVSQRSELPRSLERVSRQMRDSFTFKSYRLMNTYYGRLADSGSLEFKGVSSLKNSSTELDAPTFLEWQLGTFRADAPTAGERALSIQTFRFGARVPVVIARFAGKDVVGAPVTNYESVGLTLDKVRVAAGVPTLIGTISLPRTTGTVFLVMTIRPV